MLQGLAPLTLAQSIDFLFGGFNMVLQVLLTFMILDYITGLLTAVSARSRKTQSGKLSSKAGFRGLCKKFVILIICAVAFQLDKIMGANNLIYVGVVCFYCSVFCLRFIYHMMRVYMTSHQRI